MLAVGQEVLSQWCWFVSRNCNGFRSLKCFVTVMMCNLITLWALILTKVIHECLPGFNNDVYIAIIAYFAE